MALKNLVIVLRASVSIHGPDPTLLPMLNAAVETNYNSSPELS